MEAEKPIAVYKPTQKILRNSIMYLGIVLLFAGIHIFAIIQLGFWWIALALITIAFLGNLILEINAYQIVEVYEGHVTVKKPILKKEQTVKYEDFQKIQFGTGIPIKMSGIQTQSWKFLYGDYQDRAKKTILARFAVEYPLYENYEEEMVVQIWTRIHCKKLIDNEPAENDDIYKALKMKPHELTTSL